MVLETKLRLDNYRTMGPGLYCTAEIHVNNRRFLPIYQWDLSRLPQQYRCTGLLGRAGPELYQLVLAMVSLTKSLVLVRTAPSQLQVTPSIHSSPRLRPYFLPLSISILSIHHVNHGRPVPVVLLLEQGRPNTRPFYSSLAMSCCKNSVNVPCLGCSCLFSPFGRFDSYLDCSPLLIHASSFKLSRLNRSHCFFALSDQ